MSKKEKNIQEIDLESLDAELAASKKIEESKNTVFGKIAAVIAFAMSAYQIYIVFGNLDVIPMRAIHVAFGFSVLIMAMPLYEHVFKDKFAKNEAFRVICRIIDMVMIAALWWSVYLASNEYAHLSDNMGKAGPMGFVAGLIFLIIVLDGARRSLGWIMPILAIIFLLYARFGKLIGGSLGHKGYSWDKIMKYLALDLDGIFGTTIQVSTTVIFMFVMFGAFLEMSGCSNFINDLALSVTGKLRCGPALAAVVASALMGCISGSAVSHVVGTGTFTIPLMKSRGYRSEFASGVEAVASTGGQILPPVMGSGAFLMVVFTMEKYTTIVKAAVIPAVLYFLGAGIAVFAQGEVGDVELLPKDQIPRTRKVLKDGWLYLVIIAVLVTELLIIQNSPQMSATIACAAVPVVMLFDKKKRYRITDLPKTFVKASYSAISIVAGCACAGVVVAMVSLTGLGAKFGNAMIQAAGGSMFLSLLFTAVACIILGMGLPTTSAYVIGASILAPALKMLGLDLLTAHLFVFYFACLSAITPPVALAAYAGAGIAKCNPMKTAINACKIGFAGFIVPFVFCYNSAMNLNGTLGEILLVVFTALIGCVGMSCGMQQWYFSGQTKINRFESLIIVAAGLCMMIPNTVTSIIGLAVLAVMLFICRGKYAAKAKASAA